MRLDFLVRKSNHEVRLGRVDLAHMFEATKTESTLLVLYIPSCDRDERAIDQTAWVDKCLEMLGTNFGGGTAFPQGKGIWRDDARAGRLIHDTPVVVQCYTNDESLEQGAPALHVFLMELGVETNQRAVGFVLDDDYIEIQFP